MNYSLKEILDVPRLRELLDSLDEIHNLPSAILGIDGEIITATAWQDICTKFHRVHPETDKKCIESDRHIEARLDELSPYAIYPCPMGLVDAAMPIIIEGKHLGNVFTGQVFTEPPDEENFIKQARQYGFDETDYLAAMRKVPLYSEDKLRKNLTFIHGLTQMLAEQGLQYKRQCEAEEKLLKSKEKYQHIFENLQDVYYETTLDGTILEVSPSVKAIFGYTREELIGTSVLDFYANTDERAEFLSQISTRGRVKDFEVHFNDNKGNSRLCAMTTTLMRDLQGSPVTLIGSLRDISENKRVEEALRVQIDEYVISQKQLKESEDRFKALHDASFGGIAIHEQGLILDCNQGLSNLTGFSNEELVGMDGFKLIAPDSLERVLRNIKSDYGQSYEVEGVRKDGSVYPLAIRGKKIPYKGRLARVTEFRDITERRRSADALRSESFRLSEVIRGADIGTWEWNVQTGRMVFNERWAEIIGYVLADFPNASIGFLLGFMYPDDLEKRAELLEKHFNGQLDYYELEFRMKHKDGRWLWVLERGKLSSRTVDGEPLLMFGTLTDIDERKRREEEQQTIEKLNSVGTLAGGIAHDFNNILAGLYGNISLAKRKLDNGHPGLRFLDSAEKSMNRATLLTNQLLTFAKGGEPVKESLSLGSLVDEVVQFNLSGSNVKPVITLADDLWLVKADQSQLQQVFGNLTINARQAMPDGGCLQIVMENAEILCRNLLSIDGGKYLRITVADEGTGIVAEQLEHIFDPYFTTKQTGSGLGLATTYSIINKHGGHIGVESQLGKGTTFTLYLPASELTEFPQLILTTEPSVKKQTAKILIMDDEETIRSTVSAMLEELDYTVEAVADGQQTLEMYQQAMAAGNLYDLVILDLTIPGGMGGKETAKKILELNSAAKLIVSSGYAADPIMAHSAEYGFKGVITKPYHLNKLSEVLAQVLGR